VNEPPIEHPAERRVAIIGSGAAGVACAKALTRRGIDVTVFDGGERLEPEIEEVRRRMAGQRVAQWNAADVRLLQDKMQATVRGLPKKLTFGSDYAFRDVHDFLRVEQENASILSSLAQGGLTNMWGGNIVPWRSADFAGWPIALADLEPHYRAVLQFMPIAGVKDALAEEYPLYHDKPGFLRLSNQASEMLADLERNRIKLGRAGMNFGRARLAVRAATPGDRTSGCEYCGQCLYGCVYGHIYSAFDTLQELRDSRAIRHASGVLIEKFEDFGSKVQLTARVASDNSTCNFEFDRVFIAAGVVPTARLVLHSLGIYDFPLQLKDSQYFLVPFLRWKATRGVRSEALYSLSQIFVEMTDAMISSHTIQLQFYSYSGIYERVLRNMFPFATQWIPGFLDAVLGRLFILQNYLHSEDSGTMSLTLRRGSGAEAGTLQLTGHINEKTQPIIRSVIKKLVGQARNFGGVPAWPRLEIAPVGKGYHCGGSFPMKSQPKRLETDRLGRLGGAGRVHVVDASVLPDTCATTLVYTAMANAHRIATETAEQLLS
jgi:choline dehydrogenase-like flavoprotein